MSREKEESPVDWLLEPDDTGVVQVKRGLTSALKGNPING